MKMIAFAGLLVLPFFPAYAEPLVELSNHQSGISLSLSGGNGSDWAVEQTYHDATVADLVLYVKAKVQFSLAHNEHNTVVNDNMPGGNRLIGGNGQDGKPDSGDEGIIHYKIDRDLQAHSYTEQGTIPAWAPVFKTPFSFSTLTYDGTNKVLGAIGDNGGEWGLIPFETTKRFYYGVRDSFGNEWHSLCYWDDDVELLKRLKVNVHRQGASDGHFVAICVNPLTPVLQFSAGGAEQYYTTPLKVYNAPVIWAQTTHLTRGVKINFLNLTDTEPVFFRVDAGAFQKFSGQPLTAGNLFQGDNSAHILEAKCGEKGVICRRSIVFAPSYPAPSEKHGYLLWKNEEDRQETIKKLQNVEPFKTSYNVKCGDWYQGLPANFSDARQGWCGGAYEAGATLANAFVMAVDGPEKRRELAKIAKTRLLRMARIQPVGANENTVGCTPCKDFLNEIGQPLQTYADAGVAYDLLAGFFRQSQHPDGMTPIEEIRIRDGLAKIAHALIGQTRENWDCSIGAGSTHWALGYEIAAGTIALAMPTYKSPYYGVSGADRKSVNDFPGVGGKLWNPYPDQRVTWYQVATDPFLACPGWPNSKSPFRAEFLISDDGWWTGPNDLEGDGDREHKGPSREMIIDLSWGDGMANAECQVELVETGGYESPFVDRLYAFDVMRRIKGDTSSPLCVRNYMQRRLMGGVVWLKWDADKKQYAAQPPDPSTGIFAFNKYCDFAGLPAAKRQVATFLKNLNIYYKLEAGELDGALMKRIDTGDRKLMCGTYALAFCADPLALPDVKSLPSRNPILKPLYKYVVVPGSAIVKEIIAIDLNGEPLTLSVDNLPKGATFDPKLRKIEWTPTSADEGVHILRVTAMNSACKTVRPFPVIVKADAGKGTLPGAPETFSAVLGGGNTAIDLTWTPPKNAEDVDSYILYRDGILFAALPAGTTSYRDTEFVSPGSHTRYYLSCFNKRGAESSAIVANHGAYVTVPMP